MVMGMLNLRGIVLKHGWTHSYSCNGTILQQDGAHLANGNASQCHHGFCQRRFCGACPKPVTAPGLGVCEWSPKGLSDKSVSLIPNTDEILKLVKKMN